MNLSKRTLRGIVLGLVIASLPMLALAVNKFTDVPTAYFAHDQINNVAGAGITTGCTSATLFCPDAATTRGQMAVFLNRGLGRAAYAASIADVPVGVSAATVASAAITPGGTAAGTAMIELDATATVTCTAACTVNLRITDGTNFSRTVAVVLAAAGSDNVALNWVDQATTPGAATYTLTAESAASGVTAGGDISAVYVPFGPAGGNALQLP